MGWELGVGAEWAAEIWSATGQSAGSCHHLAEFAQLKRKTTFTFKVSIDYWLFLMLKLCSKFHLLMNLDCLWPSVCLVLSCAKPHCSLNFSSACIFWVPKGWKVSSEKIRSAAGTLMILAVSPFFVNPLHSWCCLTIPELRPCLCQGFTDAPGFEARAGDTLVNHSVNVDMYLAHKVTPSLERHG